MRTQADFREMVEKRRLTHADEIYHEWVEQLFKERDELAADRDRWRDCHQNLANANGELYRERGELTEQLTMRNKSYEVISHQYESLLSQRRDFTLTAEVKDIIQRIREWKHFFTKDEPSCIEHNHQDVAPNADCPACLMPRKPPAHDLAALRDKVEHAIGDLGIGVIVDPVFVDYIDAIIKAARSDK